MYRVKLVDASRKKSSANNARSVFSRTLLEAYESPTWFNEERSVVTILHQLTPARTHAFYEQRGKEQYDISKATQKIRNTGRVPVAIDKTWSIAQPLARGVIGEYFMLVVRDDSPRSKPLVKDSVTPVVFAGIERIMLNLWKRGFSFPSVGKYTFFVNSASVLLYDLSPAVRKTFQPGDQAGYVKSTNDLGRLQNMYFSSKNADAQFLASIRLSIQRKGYSSFLDQARKNVLA